MAEILRLVTNSEPDHEQMMAAHFFALGESILQGQIDMDQAIVVAVVDGAVTYTPIGHVTLAEGIGLLELASRKIERDARSD